VFPELEARTRTGGPKRLRLWSAACSSGEEPYTLAITALDHFGGKGWDIKILATDIDTDVLARAKAGVYAAERVETMSADVLKRHFLRGKGQWDGHYKVRPELSAMIEFRQLNFMDNEWGVSGPFDAIFCRNVVIYFDRPTQDRLFRRFHNLLAEQAYMIIGHSESLHFLSELYDPLPGTVYRRRGAGGARAPSAASASSAPVAESNAPARAAHPAPRAPIPTRAPVVKRAVAETPEGMAAKTISIGDVYASEKPTAVRTVLGSCVAACLWDPQTGVGGMNHILLPGGGTGADAASSRYGVHAMELLINSVMQKGGDRRRLRAKIFGAAHVLQQINYAGSVSERNAQFIKDFLASESIPVVGSRLGGNTALEVVFHTHDGKALVRAVRGSTVGEVANAEQKYVQQVDRYTQAPAETDISLF